METVLVRDGYGTEREVVIDGDEVRGVILCGVGEDGPCDAMGFTLPLEAVEIVRTLDDASASFGHPAPGGRLPEGQSPGAT